VLKPAASVMLAFIGVVSAIVAAGGDPAAGTLVLIGSTVLLASAGANGLTNYLDRHVDAIEGGELIRGAVEVAFRARAVVATDVDDQGIVELAEIFDGLDHPSDLIIGVG